MFIISLVCFNTDLLIKELQRLLCLNYNDDLETGLETNARPLARGELNSVRASGSSDLTSPVGEWEFYGDLSIIS